MAVLDDILLWATATLPEWQRDAMRRLLLKQNLEMQDLDDLYAMLKSAHGIPDSQARQPMPLSSAHLPATLKGTAAVVLKRMRDLKHVNRFAEGEQLEFAAKGMTVVYGGNGSGKSGYSRVLKRACRARDLSETVHPDAFDPAATKSVPEATFDVEVAGTEVSVCWKRGQTSPDVLSTIAVFDVRCARAFLDSEQDVAYLPYGLDIVESLAQHVLPSLTRRLAEETDAIQIDPAPFSDMLGETAVGKIIASLSPASSATHITNLATLSSSELTRLAELDRTLAESNPKAKAKALRLSAQRLDSLCGLIVKTLVWVNEAAVERLRTYFGEAESANRAEAMAAEVFRSGESLLSGTGGPEWKVLFEAARRFSLDHAFPGLPFPHIGPKAQCPLCQQLLDESTAKRLKRFEEFVQQDVAKDAADKRLRLGQALEKIAAAALGFGIDGPIAEEIRELNAVLLLATEEFERRVEARRKWLLSAVKTGFIEVPPALDGDPRENLSALSGELVAKAVELERAGDETQRQAIERERAELRARATLAIRLKSVLGLVERMRLKASLVKCKDSLRTNAISFKAKELASKAVTGTLRNGLNAEFQALGVGHIKSKLKLNELAEKGKMKHKLVLDLPMSKRLDEILSEGEQRAIAIGSFLAELHLANRAGAIVFDDPVSSLDHEHRKNVARRLVQEASKRQVIVLTHDTVFLGELLDELVKQGVDSKMHHLEWENGRPGHATGDLPWEHQSYKQRLDKLEQAQRALEKSWTTHPNQSDREMMRRQYCFLRATIERVIEDVLFNGVVHRFQDWIRAHKLKEMGGITQGDCEELYRLHHVCDPFVDAHDPATAKNAPVPDPTQFAKDIADLKAAIEVIRARRKTVSGPATAPVI